MTFYIRYFFKLANTTSTSTELHKITRILSLFLVGLAAIYGEDKTRFVPAGTQRYNFTSTSIRKRVELLRAAVFLEVQPECFLFEA